MKPLNDWTTGDVTAWLSTSSDLAKYAENEIEGTSGKKLMLLTDSTLSKAGISDADMRHELIGSIDILVRQHAALEVSALSLSERARAEAAAAAFARIGLTPPLKRAVTDAQLVTVAPDGSFILEPLSNDLSSGSRALAEQLYLVHTAAMAAFYNRGNCLKLAACAARLLATALVGLRVGGCGSVEGGAFEADLGETLAEICDFVSTFSRSGWLTRLMVVESDCEEFGRLQEIIAATALSHGISRAAAVPEGFTDDTGALRAAVEAAGGMDHLRDELAMQVAMHSIEPLLSEGAATASEELLTAEFADWEAELNHGGHWAIRNGDMRRFWWAAFAGADETTWERFWGKFPKNLRDKGTQGGLMAIVMSKRARDILQYKANRGNPHIATCVELDFLYPPHCNVLHVTDIAVNADATWLKLAGTGSSLKNDDMIHSAVPQLPEAYVPDVACVQYICARLRNGGEPVQVMQIAGEAGQGKLTTAVAVMRHAVMTLHWTTGYYASLQGSSSIAQLKCSLLVAFGIPAVSPDMSPLLAWLHRTSGGAHPMGLVLHSIDGMLQAAAVCQHFAAIIAELLEAGPQLQIITTSQQEWVLPASLRSATWQIRGWSQQLAAESIGLCGDKVDVEDLPAICTSSPLLWKILSRALARGCVSPASLMAEATAAGNDTAAARTLVMRRCIRLVLRGIHEDLMMALLYLSVFPLSFDVAGAAEILSHPSLHSRVAGTLNTLHRRGLLEHHVPHGRYWLHPGVKVVVMGVATDAGISRNTAKLAFVEHYGNVLKRISSVHSAGAPRAAMNLFGDEHSNLYELVQWASAGPPPESAPIYSDLLWSCMDVLSIRLDDGEKQAFCEACLEIGRQLGDSLMQGRALWQLGRLEGQRGAHGSAAVLKLDALQRLESVLGRNHLDVAKCCTGLAKTHFKLHKYPEAEDCYGRAYAIQSEALGAEHPEVLRTMTKHASVLLILGRFAHAEEVYKTVLEMREKALGLGDPLVAESLGHVGQLLQRLGRGSEAEPLLRRAVKIQRDTFGETHLLVATSLSALASLLNDLMRYEEAEGAARESLSIKEDALGENNVQVAEGFAELADLLRKQCLFDSAQSYARQAITVLMRTDAAAAAKGQCLLARIFCDAGRYADGRLASQIALDALSSRVASNGSPELSDVLLLVAHAAALVATPADLRQAEEHAGRAMGIREALFGGGSLEVAACQHMLALIYLKSDRLPEAERVCNAALNVREGVCAADDRRVADSLCTLSAVALARRRLDVAEESADRCMRIRRAPMPLAIHKGSQSAVSAGRRKRSCGLEHLEVAEAQLARARVLLAAGRRPEAEREADLCLSLRRRKLTLKHPATAEALAVCAEILLAAGRLPEAQAQAEKAAALLKGTLGAEHPQTVMATELASCCSLDAQ